MVKVIKNEENPETPEILAEAIIKISTAAERLVHGPLKPRAIETLLADMPGMAGVKRTDIRMVLENLPKLRGYWLRKK